MNGGVLYDFQDIWLWYFGENTCCRTVSMEECVTWKPPILLYSSNNDLSDPFGDHHQEEGESYHQSGQRVNRSNSASADGAFHVDGKRIKASARGEKGDDKIIYR